MGHMFGIRPWEMGTLRVGELEECNRYLARMGG
jgi:hypothetical protein